MMRMRTVANMIPGMGEDKYGSTGRPQLIISAPFLIRSKSHFPVSENGSTKKFEIVRTSRLKLADKILGLRRSRVGAELRLMAFQFAQFLYGVA